MGRKALSVEQFIYRAQGVHGTTYDYSLASYINSKTQVEIICKEHGSFWQVPSSHLKGCGCPAHWSNTLKTTFQFLENAKKVHDTVYDYSLVMYITAKTKVEIICKEHGSFWQTPSHHLTGHGCPSCGGGFNPLKPATLYYLSVRDGEAYKIGITTKSVKQRYTRDEMQDISIIEEWRFENGQKAYEKEQEIINRYKHLIYRGEPILRTGHTEMFSFDVLGLDNLNIIKDLSC